jgi:predicted glycosyltransferase
MRIVFYCQHVLGIGHLFRSLEICRALRDHAVTLVTGGPAVDLAWPGHVREFRLPELSMDSAFSGIAVPSGAELDAVRRERRRRLLELFERERPEVFVVELYPFGRKAFRFELDPLLEAVAAGRFGRCGVVCSVRDILVEKAGAAKHEARSVATLNRHFDAVLVHADPSLVRLDETFGRLADISPPLVYTGFVAARPAAGARGRIRAELGLGAQEPLIVASAGGGSVGAPLLTAVARAVAAQPLLLPKARLQVFTGPFFPAADLARLRALAGPRTAIERFSPDFLSWLAAADLSVSMAGYNTTMNLLAARVPALVWPFGQNREQRMRTERLAGRGALGVLADAELDPGRLAARMAEALGEARRPAAEVDLGGAEATARWIEGRFGRGAAGGA